VTTLKINRHWYDEVRTFIKKKRVSQWKLLFYSNQKQNK